MATLSEFLRSVRLQNETLSERGGGVFALQCVLGSILGIPHGLIYGNSTVTLLGRQSHYFSYRKGNQDTEK